MKINPINSFVKPLNFLVLAILILFFATCKRKCKTEDCYGGRFIIDGKCQCPPGSVWFKNRCNEKKPHEFYIDSLDCKCITKVDDFQINFDPRSLENPQNFDPRFGTYTFELALNYGGGSSGGSTDYNPKTQTFKNGLFSTPYHFECDWKTFVIGQFYDGRNRIKMKMYKYDAPDYFGTQKNALDSCTIWLSNRLL